MAISVKDIQEKVFPTQATNGYDVEQVDDFLDEIVEQFSAIIRENIALTEQVAKLDAELTAKSKALEEAAAKTPDYNEAGYFKNLQNAMRDTLIGAQRLADETTANAQAEALRMVNEANATAQKTVGDAQAEAEQLTAAAQKAVNDAKAESESLKAAAEAYRAAFRKMVEEQVEILKSTEILFK